MVGGGSDSAHGTWSKSSSTSPPPLDPISPAEVEVKPSSSSNVMASGSKRPAPPDSEEEEKDAGQTAANDVGEEDDEENTPPPPPQPKRKKFFTKNEDIDRDAESSSGNKKDRLLSGRAKVEEHDEGGKVERKARASSVVEILDDSDDDEAEDIKMHDAGPAGPSSSRYRTPEPEKPREIRNGKDFKGEKYFGSFITDAWATMSSNKDVFKKSKKVKIERPPVSAVTLKKQAANVSTIKEKDRDAIVRFRNWEDREIGRIEQRNANWMAKAMDLGLARFEGTVTETPAKLSSGLSTIKLSIRVYIQRSAFMSFANSIDLTDAVTPEKPKLKAEKAAQKRATVVDETKDTEEERRLKERKVSINRLFDKLRLKPVRSDAILQQHKKKGKLNSKRAMLEHYDGKAEKRLKGDKSKSKGKDAKDKGKGKAEEDDEDGSEVTENQVNEVFAKAVKNDLNLPEMDPPETFKLQLRPYQKQALKWMATKEGGVEDAREEVHLHPLWEEYNFPSEDTVIDLDAEEEPFFYNPYSGELSLEFPKASKKLRGGILADEMGLGKTIMVASLIHTNMPHRPEHLRRRAPSSSSDDSYSEEDSDAPYIPSPVGKHKKQTRLPLVVGSSSAAKDGANVDVSKIRAGRYNATLVVAPTSLLNQWRDEIQRCSGNVLSIIVYNDQKDMSGLLDELDAGVDVVIASYGKLGIEYDKYAGPDGKGFAKKPKDGLYTVDWFRVILDEAHNIKSRSTRAAKACYAIRSKRRWCLTGTPIVNRLEDLFSLLHFIRYEPWGNWAFFNSFVTVPFQNKDPKALEAIQVVLADVLLRREKSMKDKDGNPIVPLPPKKIIVNDITLSKEERAIYEKVFKDGKKRYLSYAENGTIRSNTIAILAIITRLRQACLHPSLLLKAGSKEADPAGHMVRKLVAKWMAKDGETTSDAVLERLEESDDELQPICMHCSDICEEPVFFPCEHSGCKVCMITYLTEDYDGSAMCPACGDGPNYSVKDLHQAVRQGTASSGAKSSSRSARDGSPGPTTDADDSDADYVDTKVPSSSTKSQPLFRSRSNSSSSDEGPRAKAKKSKVKGKVKAATKSKHWMDRDDFVASTKIKALIEHLEQVKQEEPLFHAVVFSQFTSFLDLIEMALTEAKMRFVRLDGSMDRKSREAAVRQFNDKSKSCVFIISMKAGGTGLNLTLANRIYVLDWWWNQAIEDQAIDRVHRFGQQREVYVYRFLVKNSIEIKMKKLQAKKTRVIKNSLRQEDEQGGTFEDFDAIFASDDDESYY